MDGHSPTVTSGSGIVAGIVMLGLVLAPATTGSAGGKQLWAARYGGPANDTDGGLSVAVSPSGSKVFVTGSTFGAATGDDYGTVAYEISTGSLVWGVRYNGSGNGYDGGHAIAASPGGGTVFVTGGSVGPSGEYDYATLAYSASAGGYGSPGMTVPGRVTTWRSPSP